MAATKATFDDKVTGGTVSADDINQLKNAANGGIDDAAAVALAIQNKVDKALGESLITDQQSSDLEAIKAIVIDKADDPSFLDTIDEILTAFSNTPEGFNVAQALSTKVNIDTYNLFVTQVNSSIDSKVDKVPGSRLGTTAEFNKLNNITGTNTGDQDLSGLQPKISGKGLSTNDFTNANVTKLASIADNATAYTDAMARAAVQKAVTTGQSLIYDQFWWDDLNDFTISGDLQASITDGKIVLTSASAASFDKILLLNNKYYNDENIVFEVTYTQVNGASTTTNGLAVGFKSTNSVTAGKQSIVARFSNLSPGTIGIINPELNTSLGGGDAINGAAHAAGDELTVRLIRNKNTYTAEGFNAQKAMPLSTATTSLNPIRKTIKNGNSTGFGWANNNTSQLGIYYVGGPIQINRVRVYTTTPKFVSRIIVGDSRVNGSFSKDESLTFANLICNHYNEPFAVFSGGGDETKDALLAVDNQIALCTGKFVGMLLGLNDLLRSVPINTAIANYLSIRDKYAATGATIIHIFVPATSADQTQFNAMVQAARPGDRYLDATVNFNASVMMSPDGSHFTPEGHRFISRTGINSGLFV